VSAYARNSKLATYQSVSVHGSVAGADPHRLVLMLMDGVLERLVIALACIERGDIGRKAQLLHSCTTLIAELRGSLNMKGGGEIARNLSDLYEYMARQLIRANAENKVEIIREVTSLLAEVRGAWVAIGPEIRGSTVSAAAGR
jgi:flagellar protein FliS